MGGVSTASDAVEMMLAGASAVAVGTASFGDPYAPVKVRDGLRDYLEKHGIERASDLTRGILPY
jgi:dihydroorotate dehydrogenase (NAD+) catalytic subunit